MSLSLKQLIKAGFTTRQARVLDQVARSGGLALPDGFYEADMNAPLAVASGGRSTLVFDDFYGQSNAPITYDGGDAWRVDRGFWFVASTYIEWAASSAGYRGVGLCMDGRYLPQKPQEFWAYQPAVLPDGLITGGAVHTHAFPIMHLPTDAVFYFAARQNSGSSLSIGFAEINIAVVQLDPA